MNTNFISLKDVKKKQIYNDDKVKNSLILEKKEKFKIIKRLMVSRRVINCTYIYISKRYPKEKPSKSKNKVSLNNNIIT